MAELTRDQEQRVFREYLKADRPVEEIMRKFGLSKAEHTKIVLKYGVAPHPNDVGNATDVRGDVVSSKDTGSGATEKPIVAKNTRELSVEYAYEKEHESEIKAHDQAISQASRAENITATKVLEEKSDDGAGEAKGPRPAGNVSRGTGNKGG